ncbi:hypothetical protein [Sanguibacter sp. 25GB23B1]|uniref:hypothetical protein n=1 Tax=unclassified Sanguibacter TaxID=2645534 RepID=UPI0032AFCC15
MLVRPRHAVHPGAALLVAMLLMIAGLVAVAPTAGAAAAQLLPLTVTNGSGLPGETRVYVIARDQATGAQGWVDAPGRGTRSTSRRASLTARHHPSRPTRPSPAPPTARA